MIRTLLAGLIVVALSWSPVAAQVSPAERSLGRCDSFTCPYESRALAQSWNDDLDTVLAGGHLEPVRTFTP